MTSDQTVKERLRRFLKHSNITAQKFEALCGLSNGYISNMRKGIGDDKLEQIANSFPNLNLSWLVLGEGEMLKTKQSSDVGVSGHVIRYWPELAATGGGSQIFNAEIKSGFRDMILPNFNDCTDAIPLVGDSMYPRYKSGQIIIIKPWTETFIEYGQIYLIVTRTNYCTVKYIHPCKDDAKITCCSENTELYPPFEIERESIHKLYIVKGAVEQNTY